MTVPLPDRIEAVFCDVGGPIYSDDNFANAVRRGLDEIRAEQGRPPVDPVDFARIYDRGRAAQSGSLRRALATELLGDESYRDELHRRLAPYWTHPEGTVYPDALEMFRRLHGHVRLAIVANQEAATVDALTRDGFAPYVDVWGISAVVGHEKPSREFFEWALRECGTTPEHTVHIGNRLDTDVRPAKALGIGTIWVLRGEAPPEPTPEQLAEADLAVPDLTTVGRRHPRTRRVMTPLTLGIDLATASARCVALDTATGSVVAQADSALSVRQSVSRVACRAKARRMRRSPSSSSGGYAGSSVPTPLAWPRCRSPAPPAPSCRSTGTGRRSVPLASTTTPPAATSWPRPASPGRRPSDGWSPLRREHPGSAVGLDSPTSSTPRWPVGRSPPTPRTGSRPGSTSPLGAGRSTR